MKATWVQTSFNAGEWTPLAYGRFDLAKYKNGLAECKNFAPTQQGGLTRRPGTRAVSAVKDSSYAPRLQRFEFSITQAYVLEFGNNYIRFFANDGQLTNSSVPYEVTTTYTASEVWELNFAQSADTLYITHPNHPPTKLQRVRATPTHLWTLTTISFLDGPYLGVNTTNTTMIPSATSGTVTVTASSTTGINAGVGFRTSDVGRMLRLKCGGVWLWGTIASRISATKITWTITSSNGQQLPATAKAVANVSGGSVFTVSITDGGSGYSAQPPSVTFTQPTTTTATAHISSVDGTGKITGVVLDTGGSGYYTDPVVTVSGGTGGHGALLYAHTSGGVVISLYVGDGGIGYSASDGIGFAGGGATTGTSCVAYASVSNGVVTSITVMVTGTGYTTAPDVVLSAPAPVVASTTTFWRLGNWNSTDGYPSCVNFHQDRLWWAGATSTPGRVDASNSGDYENMAPSNQDGTVVDSNALSFTLNAGAVNAIRWMMSDEWGMLIGTAGSEWAIAPSSTQQAITPTNVNAKQMTSYGSAAVTPLRVGKATLFIQRTGRKLRELFYQFTYNTFQALDISLVAEHLTQSGIKQFAQQLAPQQITWIVRNDGKLVAMTYDKDQEICGWHQHSLGGFSDAAQTLEPLVESVVSIPAPGIQRDEVWLLVKRYINGAVVRYVEVMDKFWENGDTTTNCCFLDCSEAYAAAGGTTVTNLDWLKGQTVGVLTDGAVHPDCVVDSNGDITLTRAATTVQVGLKYTSSFRTLPIEAGGADGPSQGKLKRVYLAVVRLFQSVGLTAGSNDFGITSYPQPFRTSADPMSGPVGLYDGDKRWAYEGTYLSEGQVYFETSDPLPCNITMVMAKVDTQDYN